MFYITLTKDNNNVIVEKNSLQHKSALNLGYTYERIILDGLSKKDFFIEPEAQLIPKIDCEAEIIVRYKTFKLMVIIDFTIA